jgi:hypothetical protein
MAEGSIVEFTSQIINIEALSELDGFLDEFDGLDAEREIFKPKIPFAQRSQRVVIVHPELGIYVGSYADSDLWSLTGPHWWQPLAVTFSGELSARAFVVAKQNRPELYRYVWVPACDEENCEEFAGREELTYAGLEPLFGPMFDLEDTADPISVQ